MTMSGNDDAFVNTQTPLMLTQQSAAMGWSKEQFLSTPIMEKTDAHKAGKGYKKIAEEVFQVSIS